MTPTDHTAIRRRAQVRATADAEMLFLDLEEGFDAEEVTQAYLDAMAAMFRERMGDLMEGDRA